MGRLVQGVKNEFKLVVKKAMGLVIMMMVIWLMTLEYIFVLILRLLMGKIKIF